MNPVDWRYIDNRIARALHALDEIAEKLGSEWDDAEWDELASARSLIREFEVPKPSALTEPGVLTAPPSDPSGGATGTSGSAPGSVNA